MKGFVRALLMFQLIVLSVVGLKGQELVLPELFPEFTITANNDADEGYLFMTTHVKLIKKPASLVIIDNYGTPVYYKHMTESLGGFCMNKNGLLTYRAGRKFYVMDSSYVVIDSVAMENYSIDGHDFLALEDGHYIIFGSDYRTEDMTAYGGVVDATLDYCVVQELDADKNVVFEWNSADHFSIEDTYRGLTSSAVELVHPNSLEIDYDGAILMVGRAMDEVTKISRETGDVVWRLGGKNNQFTFSDTLHRFSMPHDFRLLDNGHYTIFDNGQEKDPAYSRGVEYVLDTDAMTCDIVWEFDADKRVYSKSGGNARRLASGNTIIAYGGQVSAPAVTEVHDDGSKALQLEFVDGMVSDRITKHPWRTTLFEPNTYKVNFGEWDGYTESEYLLTMTNNADHVVTLTGYSVRTSAFTIDESFPIDIPANGSTVLTLIFYPHEIASGVVSDVMTIDSDINSDTLIQRISQQVALTGTMEDFETPYASFALVGDTDDSLQTKIVLEFNESIYKLGGDSFDYLSVDALLTLREGNDSGAELGFDAVINTDKNKIVVFPDAYLSKSSDYYFALSDQYEDHAGNQGEALVETILSGSQRFTERSEMGMKIYPNPGNGLFDIDFELSGSYIIKLYSMTGVLLERKTIVAESRAELDIRSLASGQYVLFVRNCIDNAETAILLIKE